MSNLEFFKKQAKNFLKDWQTQSKHSDENGFITYQYQSKFFNVSEFFFYFEYSDKDEQDIKLARAQHIIAKIAGFKKWDELIHASSEQLELAELILRHVKNSEDLQYWEDNLMFSGLSEQDISTKLDFGKQYFRLEDSKQLAQESISNLTLIEGSKAQAEMKSILSENSPFNLNSKISCSLCESTFLLKESKVIQSKSKPLSMIVCKNFPNCKGTFLDYYDPDEDPYNGGVPFDSDMDQGYVDEFE